MDRHYYEYEADGFYCYEGTYVLKNFLDITDDEELKVAEREITSLRIAQATIEKIDGNFDFEHLKAIHKFIFQDIYFWAGETRNVDISKGSQFCLYQFIEPQMQMLLGELARENYLRDYEREEFISRLAYYFGEINAIHPFREGNGRTQRLYIEYLSAYAGYQLNFMEISSEEMLEASVQSFHDRYELLEKVLERALRAEE